MLDRRGFLISLLGTPAVLTAQQDPVFSTDVKVVSVLATARDKRGAIIRDLTRDDFSLVEDGRPQTIRYFATQSDLPLTLGLLVDTSMSQQHVLSAERGASSRFLDQVLRETKDRVFLMQFDMTVQIKQELTSSRRNLDEALAFVDTPSFRELQNQRGGGTLLYDAVVEASRDVMQKVNGRKALIIMSDGVDTGSDAPRTAAIETAQRADTLIYSILFSDSGAYGMFGGQGGRNALEQMSKATGGGFFEVTKKQGIDRIFDIIQDELRSQYNLGYVSDRPVVLSEFRKIALTAKKGLTVQARERYWARR